MCCITKEVSIFSINGSEVIYAFNFCLGLSQFERNPSSFHLLGLDFMVTDDFQVWFIEANGYPLWPKASSSKVYSFIDEHIVTMGVCVEHTLTVEPLYCGHSI